MNGRANVAFTLATRAGAMPKNFRPVLGDLDGDGDDDLIVAGTNLAAPIAYFVNVGHGSFVPDDTAMEHVNSNLVGSDTTFGPGEQLPTLLSLRGPSFSPDLIIVDSDSGEVRVFRSRHRTYFPIEKEDNPFSKINEKEDNPFSGKLAALSFADIDDNGKMDIQQECDQFGGGRPFGQHAVECSSAEERDQQSSSRRVEHTASQGLLHQHAVEQTG